MELEELHLKRYKRFYVSGIQEFKYRPKRKIQVILGRNGSGKSSLLKEIIPNVDDVKNEYDTNGFKYIKYNHRNNVIELRYDRDSNRHSFKLNGEELNQSGLIKTQKSLIEEHFNITKEIHDLLTSELTFTNMTVNERKKWFTTILTHLDYSYALDLFNRAKDRLRDIKAIIKLTRNKIVKERELMDKYTSDYVKTLKDKRNLLQEFIEKLLVSKSLVDDVDIDAYLSKIEKLNHTLRTLYTVLVKHVDKLPKVDDELAKLKAEYNLLTSEKDKIVKTKEKLNNHGLLEDNDKHELEKEKKELEIKLNELEKLNVYNLDLRNIENVYNTWVKIQPTILDLVYLLQELHNETKGYDLDTVSKNRSTVESKINNIKDKLIRLASEIDHLDKLKNSNKTKCPKCGYVFIPNYDEKRLEQLKIEHERLSKELSELSSSYSKISDINDKLLKEAEIRKDLFNLFPSDLEGIKHVLERTVLQNMVNKITEITTNIETLLPYGSYTKRLQEIENKLNILEKVNYDKLKFILEHMEELDRKYSNIVKRLNGIKYELDRLTKLKQAKDKFKTIYDALYVTLSKLPELKRKKLEQVKNEYINELIKLAKEELVNVEQELTDYSNLKTRYDNLVKELDQYEQRHEAVKVLVDLLSPTKGIIGKSVVNVINDIIMRMNDIINQIWTYPIEIQTCNVDENDLTYRFPVLVNRNKLIPDVSKGSSSIREVIDLAFKIVAMEYLNMLDYPLILDEFGRTMDPKHRIKAYDFIEELSKSYFSQIYLVSHFESMYNRFVDTDVIILDNENVGYDNNYNEVVEIK